MGSKKYRLLEAPSGVGKVYKQGQPIADVRYSLQVMQEYLITRSFSGTQELEGLKDIKGQVTVIDGERNLITGDVLTLELDDGRQFQFFASRGDPVSAQYTIAIVGGGLG